MQWIVFWYQKQFVMISMVYFQSFGRKIYWIAWKRLSLVWDSGIYICLTWLFWLNKHGEFSQIQSRCYIKVVTIHHRWVGAPLQFKQEKNSCKKGLLTHGKSTSVFTDQWLPTLPLRCIQNNNLDPSLKVCDLMVQNQRVWDIPKINAMFTQQEKAEPQQEKVQC